jgi:hypothetical protein
MRDYFILGFMIGFSIVYFGGMGLIRLGAF